MQLSDSEVVILIKNIDTLKIHIVIDFASKVFKNTPYWYKISDKNQNNTTNLKNVKQIKEKMQKSFAFFKIYDIIKMWNKIK